jgi:hypothetical protein
VPLHDALPLSPARIGRAASEGGALPGPLPLSPQHARNRAVQVLVPASPCRKTAFRSPKSFQKDMKLPGPRAVARSGRLWCATLEAMIRTVPLDLALPRCRWAAKRGASGEGKQVRMGMLRPVRGTADRAGPPERSRAGRSDPHGTGPGGCPQLSGTELWITAWTECAGKGREGGQPTADYTP